MKRPTDRHYRPALASGVTLLLAGSALLSGAAAAAVRTSPRTVGDGPTEQPQLVFGGSAAADGPSATFTIHADGSRLREINPQSGAPHWSPDGAQLTIDPCDDPSRPSCPVILNPSGRVLRALSVPAVFQRVVTFWRPSIWSPDGIRLAGGASSDDPSLNGVYTVRASDGLGLRRITTNPDGGEDAPGAYSPDGTRIEFARRPPDGAPPGGAIFVVNLDGSHLTRITPVNLDVDAEQGFGDWSPDGTRIVFAARPASDRRYALFTVAPNGTGLRQLPLPCGSLLTDPEGHGCGEPSYSPNGRQLAYTGFDAATGQTHIWLANSDGTDAHQLTTDVFGGQADWRP